MGFLFPSYLPTLLINNIILLFGGVTVALCCLIEDWHILLTLKHPLNFPAILNDTKLPFPSFSDLTLIQPHESLSRQWKSRNKREMLEMKDIFVFVTLAASIQGKKKSMQFIA